MANISLQELLSSPVVTRVISQLPNPQSRLQTIFGCQPDGPNVLSVGGRTTAWDIFNRTRGVARMRSPGTGPSTVKPQIIGHVNATIPRAHEKMFLSDDKLHRQRPLGQGWGTVDIRGERYVTSQERHLAQRMSNWREFLISRAIRGSFQVFIEGDDHYICDTGGHMTVDYQCPYAAKTLAEMKALSETPIGSSVAITPYSGMAATKWDTVATADIVADILALNSGAEAMHGRPITDAFCNSVTIQYLLNNTGLKNLAGTSNVVWSQFDRVIVQTAEGPRDAGLIVVFKGIPWLRFHVYDAGLDVPTITAGALAGFTYTKFFPDNFMLFIPEVDGTWFEWQEGSEIVRENDLDQGSERFGLAAWSQIRTQPSGFELLSLDNGLPVFYVPRCLYYLQVADF